MSKEQPASKSDNYGFNEEWEGVGELAEVVTETIKMSVEVPFEVMSDIAGAFLEGFESSSAND